MNKLILSLIAIMAIGCGSENTGTLFTEPGIGGSAGAAGDSGSGGSAGETSEAGIGGSAGTAGDSGTEVSTNCNPGDTGCDGKVLWHCDQSGTKQTDKVCDFVCENATCIGACEPGTVQCDSVNLILQLCNSHGDLVEKEKCVIGCDTDHCVGKWCCTDFPAQGSCVCHAKALCDSGQVLNSCPAEESFCCIGNKSSCDCYTQQAIGVTCEEQLKLVGSPDDAIVDHCGAN